MLNERIVISHFCVGHELFYFLFFAFGADEQHIIGFGYDVIVKSFDNVYGEPWLKGKFKAK